MIKLVLCCSLLVEVLVSQPVSQSPPSPLSQSVSGLSSNLLLSLAQTAAPTQNVVISPVSIFLALSLLQRGSQDSTRSELDNFLGLDSQSAGGLDTKALLKGYIESRQQLNTTIQLANVLFADNTLSIKDDYQRNIWEALLSQVQTVDFADGIPAVKSINNWVKNKTNNLITDFITPELISESTRLLVLNAIYFKANWKNPFQEYETIEKVKFDVTPHSEVEVAMMSKSDDILYQSNTRLNSDIVSLPYEDENFQMMIFLPHDHGDNSLQSLIQKFPGIDFNDIYGSLSVEAVDLYLPKFSISYKSELVTPLRNYGVVSMFSPEEADFSKISDESLRVSNILHETKIEVTEEGSEAVGLTGAVLDLRTVISDTYEVNLNRPFVFVVHDRKNNIPLFIGKVVNPSSETPREKINVNDLGNTIALRTVDPEELAHISNARQEDLVANNCSKLEYANTDKVYFPCHPRDTKPIEDYKRVHGDPSLLGVNGEQAALLNI